MTTSQNKHHMSQTLEQKQQNDYIEHIDSKTKTIYNVSNSHKTLHFY